VNPATIKIYDGKTDSGTLILEGDYAVPVSQRKKRYRITVIGKQVTGILKSPRFGKQKKAF
jgi:hypothetical protein